MNAGFLDMFHDASDDRVVAISDTVNVDFDGFFKEAVDQDRLAAGNDKRFENESFELGLVVTDLHRAAAEHKAWADENRIADFGDDFTSVRHVVGHAVGRLFQIQFVQQLLKFFAIFGGFDGVDAGSDDWNASVGKSTGQVQRRLASELNDDSVRLDVVANVQHVFDCQRLEEQQVTGVVIRTDGFRVRVDHDRFDAHFAKCKTRVAAAVVELDSLADSVGTAAENDDSFLVAFGWCFAL